MTSVELLKAALRAIISACHDKDWSKTDIAKIASSALRDTKRKEHDLSKKD